MLSLLFPVSLEKIYRYIVYMYTFRYDNIYFIDDCSVKVFYR
jgi:hypothetical protein